MSLSKTSALAVAALAIGFAVAPVHDAEARNGRKGALIGGLAAGAILGGALLAAPRAYGHPVYGGPVYHSAPAYGGPVYVEEAPTCYFVRRRVWDEYRGHWVRVRQRVCE